MTIKRIFHRSKTACLCVNSILVKIRFLSRPINTVELRLCALRSKKTYDYMQSFLEEATTFLSHIIQDILNRHN
jgi:hypothetical protein